MAKKPEMKLKTESPKKEAPVEKPKKTEYPAWTTYEDAEIGVVYQKPNGNLIQKGTK
tara:strand:- start:135 stop:305 length:171 start_codon:yes stop_codon:yes gene_type:complete